MLNLTLPLFHYHKLNICFCSLARPELVKVDKEVEVVLKFPDVDPLNPPVLTMTDVAFQYNEDKVIFNCVNLNANLESRICIVNYYY